MKGLSIAFLYIGLSACAPAEIQHKNRFEPESLTPTKTQVYEADLAENMPKSSPQSPHIPLALGKHFVVRYQGAFRALARGESSSNYAVGTLGLNPQRNSIYLAGHAHHNAIAEFAIPSNLSFEQDPKRIVKAKVLQPYVRVLSDANKKPKASHGNLTNRINGILYFKGKLLVTSEIWYDGGGRNKDNLQVLDADNLSANSKGMLQLEGAAQAAGYMFPIPKALHNKFGAEYGLGWSSVYSITSRYSQGPSFFTFDPQDAFDIDIKLNRQISTRAIQVYPFGGDKDLVKGASKYSNAPASPVWSAMSKGRYGFIVPNSNIFMVLGSHGGIHAGIGYKIRQDTGRLCGGGCTVKASDNYNYFWLYNINDMLNSENPWDSKPFSYGKWILPYKGSLNGATFDIDNNMLYITIANAARVGDYDRPPLIVAYQIKSLTK